MTFWLFLPACASAPAGLHITLFSFRWSHYPNRNSYRLDIKILLCKVGMRIIIALTKIFSLLVNILTYFSNSNFNFYILAQLQWYYNLGIQPETKLNLCNLLTVMRLQSRHSYLCKWCCRCCRDITVMVLQSRGLAWKPLYCNEGTVWPLMLI